MPRHPWRRHFLPPPRRRPRGLPMAFHLDGGAGSALAGGSRVSAPPSLPPPEHADPHQASHRRRRLWRRPVAVVSPVAQPDAGGRGWGIREQKPSMYPAWTPIPASAGSTGGPSPAAPTPASGSIPATATRHSRSSGAPRVGRSRSACVPSSCSSSSPWSGAGAFLYLGRESTRVSARGRIPWPLRQALGGLPASTGAAMTALSSRGAVRDGRCLGHDRVVFKLTPRRSRESGLHPRCVASDGSGRDLVRPQSVRRRSQRQQRRRLQPDHGSRREATGGVSFRCAPVTLTGAPPPSACGVTATSSGWSFGASGAGAAATLSAAEEARSTASADPWGSATAAALPTRAGALASSTIVLMSEERHGVSRLRSLWRTAGGSRSSACAE